MTITIQPASVPGDGGSTLCGHHGHFVGAGLCLVVIGGARGTGAGHDTVPVAPALVVLVAGTGVDKSGAGRAVPQHWLTGI